MPETELQDLIYNVSFFRRKADYLKRTARILTDEHNGDVPGDLDAVLALPGVGPKMAYLFLQVAYNKTEGIGVDTHVHRISRRLGWTDAAKCKTPEHTRKALQAWLPKEYWRPINALLVGFGQTVCTPTSPKCNGCAVREYCPFAQESYKYY